MRFSRAEWSKQQQIISPSSAKLSSKRDGLRSLWNSMRMYCRSALRCALQHTDAQIPLPLCEYRFVMSSIVF